MTRMSGSHRMLARTAVALAAAALAVGAALAHGGYGPGHGMGCGAGYGPGSGPECAAGAGPGRGTALLNDEERSAHRARMQSLTSVDECRTYISEFSRQLQAKAQDKGVTVGGPNAALCDRMQAHGRFAR